MVDNAPEIGKFCSKSSEMTVLLFFNIYNLVLFWYVWYIIQNTHEHTRKVPNSVGFLLAIPASSLIEGVYNIVESEV